MYIKEITAPKGYKLNTNSYNVNLEVAKTQMLTVKNEEQKGKIVVHKQGEKLTGVSGEEGNLQFLYTNAAFAGAKYKICAAEDIYSRINRQKSIKQEIWQQKWRRKKMEAVLRVCCTLELIK